MKMRQKSQTRQTGGDKAIKDIRRATRKQYSAEEKIRIVLDGLRGEESIAELCRREGIAESIYYKWSKEFLEAGKRRLAGDTARAASTGEVTALRREATAVCSGDASHPGRQDTLLRPLGMAFLGQMGQVAGLTCGYQQGRPLGGPVLF